MKIKYLSLATIILAFFASTVSAGGDFAGQEPIVKTVIMSEYKFEPSHMEFETGKLYKLIIKNIGKEKHEIDSAAISHMAYTKKIQIMDKKGGLIAEVKGSIAEIEVGPGHEIEWWFVPVATTGGPDEVVCLLPGHYEAGMKGDFTFK